MYMFEYSKQAEIMNYLMKERWRLFCCPLFYDAIPENYFIQTIFLSLECTNPLNIIYVLHAQR